MVSSPLVVCCHGITKNPETNEFMMVMQYADNGSLRQHLNNNFSSINWFEKLEILKKIARGLNEIHEKGLIHHDFHCNNILNSHDNYTFITDLGLCQPANVKPTQNNNKNIYGVLPYVAPEVLRGKEYTQASDIYGFGIIAYEVCTGFPPYHDVAHDEFLAIKICQGLRPKCNYKIPQLILDIIKQYWDADPLKRLKADKLYELLKNLYELKKDDENSLINKQMEEAEEINKQSPSSIMPLSLYNGINSCITHPQAVYTSRLLDFNNLPEPKNAIDSDNDNGKTEYSGN